MNVKIKKESMFDNLASEVQIWYTFLGLHAKHYKLFQAWLSTEEKIKAARLTTRSRQRFILSKGILRNLLSRYNGQPSEKIKFAYSEFGKPRLMNCTSRAIEFNISHSRNRIALAFTENTPIGIDIEYKLHRKHIDKIAYRFFSAQDYSQLANLHEQDKLKAFYNRWVHNEALLKTFGQPLKTHALSQYTADRKRITSLKTKKKCTVLSLILEPNFFGALAINGHNKAVKICTFNSLI